MNREALERELRSAGVNDHTYDLWDQAKDEAYGLRCGEQWRVVYRERSEENELFASASEDEACRWLLDKILSDPTTTQMPGTRRS